MQRLQIAVVAIAFAVGTLLVEAQTQVTGVFFNEGWESGSKAGSFNSNGFGDLVGSSQFLVQNAERVISRDELLNEVWGYQNYPSTRTVDNHILKLRQKLEKDPSSPVHFRTVHGMGYKFVR